MEVIEKQIMELKLDRITLSFKPREVVYEPETDKVFISGIQTSSGPGGKPKQKPRTYEIIIDLNDYKPVIAHINAYADQPKTLQRLKMMEESSTSH